MGRTATGVKGIDLPDDAKVVGVVTSMEGNKIFSLSTLGFGKITDGTAYRITSRGSKGVITMKSGEKNGHLLTIKTVQGDEDIIIITDKGTTIRTTLTQVKNCSRNTIGVKIITLRQNEEISSCCIEPSEAEYEATNPETPDDNKDPSSTEGNDNSTSDDAALNELLKRAESTGDDDDSDDDKKSDEGE